MSEWNVHIKDDVFSRALQVLIYRENAHDNTFTIHRLDGTIQIVPADIEVPHDAWVAFPRGCEQALLTALRARVGIPDRYADDLRADLLHERDRVDRLIAYAIDGQ